MHDVHKTLVQSIQNRHVLFLRYRDGHQRTVEPYSYWLTPSGRAMFRAYQREGFSVSGETTGWKTFSVLEIQGLHLTAEQFELPPRDGYDPFNTSIGRFFALIAPEPPAWLRDPYHGLRRAA